MKRRVVGRGRPGRAGRAAGSPSRTGFAGGGLNSVPRARPSEGCRHPVILNHFGTRLPHFPFTLGLLFCSSSGPQETH